MSDEARLREILPDLHVGSGGTDRWHILDAIIGFPLCRYRPRHIEDERPLNSIPVGSLCQRCASKQPPRYADPDGEFDSIDQEEPKLMT